MNILLFAFSVFVFAQPSQEYDYHRPQQAFAAEDAAAKFGIQIVEGNNGKKYEITISPSKQLYENRVLVNEQPLNPATEMPPVHNFLKSAQDNVNSHQSFNNQQQNFNLNANQQHSGSLAANIAQNQYNHFQANAGYQKCQQQVNYQQQVVQRQQQPNGQTPFRTQEQPQIGAFPHQQQQHQQQFAPFPGPAQQQPVSSSDTHKYISQSEASQLDVYPYKQINGNPRAFTRTISICDASGRCETQDAAVNSLTGDFDQQPKAQVAPNTACNHHHNAPNQVTDYAPPNDKASEHATTPDSKGSNLQGRRLFPYTEVVLTQYPYN